MQGVGVVNEKNGCFEDERDEESASASHESCDMRYTAQLRPRQSRKLTALNARTRRMGTFVGLTKIQPRYLGYHGRSRSSSVSPWCG